MRKSIFEKLEQNFSNPLDEYFKISLFVNEANCHYSDTIYECFAALFSYCEVLRKHYSSLDDCVSDNLGILANYSCGFGNDTFNTFEDEIKNEIEDSFLTYVEIMSCMLCVFRRYGPSVFGSVHIKKQIIDQFEGMINESLRSINYKIETKNEGNVQIIKIDPVSELIANQSTPNMKVAILNYLSIRNGDIAGKEKALHDIIDLLEPIFKKYGNVEIVKTAKEYAQIIRHPEIKKNEKEYYWFVNNKNVYLNKLFNMCVFTQQYALNKDIVSEFNEQKKNAINQ